MAILNTPARRALVGGFHFPVASMWNAMRPMHWVKNLVVVAVPLMTEPTLSLASLGLLVGAFALFCIMSSGTYVFNDIMDIDADRLHDTKCARPVASGALSIQFAAIFSALLVGGSLIAAFHLNWLFGAVLGAYAILSALYSLYLKSIPILDAGVIALLFGMRAIAGSLSVDTAPSVWMSTFVLVSVFGLVLAKRYSELSRLGGGHAIPRRGYLSAHRPIVLILGVTICAISVLFLAVSSHLSADPRTVDHTRLALLGGILAGLYLRIWRCSGTALFDRDPIIFVIKDRLSLCCMAMLAFVALITAGSDV